MKSQILNKLIIDVAVCLFFVFSCMFILSITILDGYTKQFLERGYKLVGVITIITSIVFFIFWKINKFKIDRNKIKLPKFREFILLTIPMSPVLDFAFHNLEYLSFIGMLYMIFLTLSFAILLGYILPIFFSYFGSYNILMASGLALSFTILNIPKINSNPNNHLFDSQFVTQGAYLTISFIIIYSLYILNKRILYIFSIIFVLTGVSFNTLNIFSTKSINSNLTKKYDDFFNDDKNKIINKKDIYILIYESYANLETLNYYGFNNSKQMKFLEENNFKIYHGTYSNAATSLNSTSRILEIDGPISKHGRYYLSGNSFGLNILKSNSYKTIGLFSSPFPFGSYPIRWDEYYPKENVKMIGGKIITKAIFQGEFRFDIFNDDYDYSKYLNLKNYYLKSKINKPKLFFTHNNYPGHSQNSGKCLPNERFKYFEGMKKANLEMRNDISNIKKNNPNSIIVIAGDHGPYLTKNCKTLIGYDKNDIDRFDIQDRYGSFLAINWPEELMADELNLEILQDIFPAILTSVTENKNLFEELKVERKFFDKFNTITGGINVLNGIIQGGKDDGKPLFEKTFNIKN